jgi:hypothetical protein
MLAANHVPSSFRRGWLVHTPTHTPDFANDYSIFRFMRTKVKARSFLGNYGLSRPYHANLGGTGPESSVPR